MFKRTFKVVYRPVKSNFLLLPENYYSVVSTYDTGCLSLQYNAHIHYASWAPHAGTVKDTEIGINARVAKEIGLNENDLVKCTLIADVLILKNVYVTPVSAKDWEIIELSSEKISGNVLEQTRIVNSSQILIVWINKSMQVALTVDRIKPNVSYGRIDHTTEMIVAPNLYKGLTNGSATNGDLNGVNGISNKLSRSRTAAQVRNQDDADDPHLMRSTTLSDVNKSTRTKSLAVVHRHDKMERLKKDLRRENTQSFEFRVIGGEWHEKAQVSDVFITKSNRPEFMDLDNIYCMRTPDDQEYYVKVRIARDNDEIPQTIHATIEINVNLMKKLNLKEMQKVVLKPKAMVVNFVEKIELFAHKKTHYKIVENAFKRFVIEKTNFAPMLLNQDEVIRCEEELILSVGILPEHFRYCVVDAQFLKECKIYAADLVRKVDDVIDVDTKVESLLSVKDLIKLPEFDGIVGQLVDELKANLCLDASNAVLRQGNILIAGAPGTGKTVLVERVIDQLTRKPFYCFFDIFYCTRSKGRKAESIQKDLRSIFTTCLQNAPSIVVLENLDVLAHATGEQETHDAEYFNRIADTVHQLIVQYTNSNPIAVIATVNKFQALNKRLYSPRGRHLFQTIIKLPNLERSGREIILSELCSHIDAQTLDLAKFANLTEGYNKGDLVQFVERAIFYAYRISKSSPVLTNEHLINSLENTNSYCLQGIQTHQKTDGSDEAEELCVEDIPGLEPVVSVLEEVLMWPSRYPTIFNGSPLRNQAGVLLYGPPGTGKTFLVSKISTSWNLRTISVKGPELLAKYIGQSEENVRNLFNRARSAKPCVLFFDEFDSLAPKRGHDSTGVTDRVVNQLLTELDGVESLQGVTVIAATSRPELLDPALLRSGRIDRLVECPLPDATARVGIFEVLSATLNLDDSVDFDFFASRTQNYTGADIQSILTTASMTAVKEALATFGPEGYARSLSAASTRVILLDAAPSFQEFSLPANSDVEVVCPSNESTWYWDGRWQSAAPTLKLTALRAEQSGRYSCRLFAPHSFEPHWANFSLHVTSPKNEDDIADFVTVEDQRLKLAVEPGVSNATSEQSQSQAHVSSSAQRFEPFHLEIEPHNQTAYVGEDASFFCNASSSSPDRELDFYWYKDDEKSATFERQSLDLENVQHSDEGWYSCVAADKNNKQQIQKSSAYLKVIAPRPELSGQQLAAADVSKAVSSFAETDHNATAEAGEEFPPKFKKKMVKLEYIPSGRTAKINCAATGNPPPTVTWTRNVTDSIINRRIGGVTFKRWSLEMADVITDDSGSYKCTVCNKLGCIEHVMKLIVKERLRAAPILSDKFPQNQTVLVNTSTHFECRAFSDMEPHFLWFKYTRPNTSITKIEELIAKGYNSILETDQNRSEPPEIKNFVRLTADPDKQNILRLENVTYEDEGWYTCIVGSSLGYSKASAYLSVVAKLPSREVYTLRRAHPMWITVVAIVVVLLFLLGSIFIIYVLRKLKHEKLLKHRIETVHQWTKKVIIYKPPSSQDNSCDLQMPVIKIEKQRTTFEASAHADATQGFNEYEFPLDSNWEIPRNQLTLGSTLGEGAFGRVVRANVTGLQRAPQSSAIVAVKMVKEEHTDADMASLVREMEVMKMIGKHINIINLLGCCTQNGPLWVIVEFAPHGNLKDFLKQHRPMAIGSPSMSRHSGYLEDKLQLTEKKLISFAYQIARGMEYLASKRKLPHKMVVKQKHLVESFETTRPSLSASDVAKYHRTYARFTNKEKSASTRDVAKRATLA